MTPTSVLLVLTFCLISVQCQTVRSLFDSKFTAKMTQYKDDSQGRCEFWNPYHKMANLPTVALGNWNNGEKCGMCVMIYPKGKISAHGDLDKRPPFMAYVNNECPECGGTGHIDLLDPNPTGEYSVDWQAVDCPVSGNIEVIIKEGSNDFFLSLLVRNYRVPLSKVEFNINGGWTAPARNAGNMWVINGRYPAPLQVRVTSITGETKEFSISQNDLKRIRPNVISTNVQFSGIRGGGGSSGTPPTGGCPDVLPPESQYSCAQQAAWGKCTEAWMTGYCKLSCNTCGTPNPPPRPVSNPLPPSACNDVSPPDSQYSCAQQAAWGKCTETWMTGYCKLSCNTCGTPSTPPPPPPAPCVDTAPSGSQYTCTQQAAWGKCTESWMEGFCLLSCRKCTPSAIGEDTFAEEADATYAVSDLYSAVEDTNSAISETSVLSDDDYMQAVSNAATYEDPSNHVEADFAVVSTDHAVVENSESYDSSDDSDDNSGDNSGDDSGDDSDNDSDDSSDDSDDDSDDDESYAVGDSGNSLSGSSASTVSLSTASVAIIVIGAVVVVAVVVVVVVLSRRKIVEYAETI